jgi:hypothetical protein
MINNKETIGLCPKCIENYSKGYKEGFIEAVKESVKCIQKEFQLAYLYRLIQHIAIENARMESEVDER